MQARANISETHLRYADNVIVLDSKGGVCSDIELDDSTIDEKSDEVLTKPIYGPSPTEAASLITTKSLDVLEDPKLDGSRSTGDLKVYAYYAKIAGRWTMASYLVACAAYVFCMSFPCKTFITQQLM
jgi:ATP-binding cassette, subfamily C (CFTR/MRP), member 1